MSHPGSWKVSAMAITNTSKVKMIVTVIVCDQDAVFNLNRKREDGKGSSFDKVLGQKATNEQLILNMKN